MGRRPREDDDAISLFPFLSILACVIGTLTLMIAAMALGQLDPEAVADAEKQIEEAEARAEKHTEAMAAIEVVDVEANKLRALIAEAEAVRQQLARARAELKALEAESAKMTGTDAASAKLLAEANRQRERIKQLEAQLPEMKAELDKLKAELAKLDKPPPPAQVRIEPGGSGAKIDPYFVECDRGGVVLLDGDGARIPRGDLTGSPVFAKAMEAVRKRERGVMIFLVRPDGVYTYNTASDVARVNQTRNGKLPVSGQGEIDLSRFRGGNK